MLLRYAEHFAAGQGITWNVGEPPVEGATDFLFLVAVAATIKISHLGAIYSARILLTMCHLASVAFLYVASRKIFSCHRAIAALFALYVGTGPVPMVSAVRFTG